MNVSVLAHNYTIYVRIYINSYWKCTQFALSLLCLLCLGIDRFYPYVSGWLHCYWNNHTISVIWPPQSKYNKTMRCSPLWPCDGVWRHRSGSTLAQVMACFNFNWSSDITSNIEIGVVIWIARMGWNIYDRFFLWFTFEQSIKWLEK